MMFDSPKLPNSNCGDFWANPNTLPKQEAKVDEERFRNIYADALNYGFAAMGKHISRIVTDYLSRKYELTLPDTFANPRLLSEALEKSLGYGAVLVETRIVKSLRSNLGPVEGVDSSQVVTIRRGHPEDFEKYLKESFQAYQSKMNT